VSEAAVARRGDHHAPKGLKNARVLDKVNQRGEVVIAIVILPRQPGEWR
jgi:hypothetical protein